MTFSEALHSLSACPEAVPSDEVADALREAAVRYPFSPLPQALMLRYGLVDDTQLGEIRARVAVLMADKQALASAVAAAGDDPACFYPPQELPSPVSTDSAIDTFLTTYGQISPEEEAMLEKLIFNPVPDYADVLEASEREAAAVPPVAEAGSQDALIDAFLRRDEPAAVEEAQPAVASQPVAADPASEHEPAATGQAAADSSLSESLARIFIGQGRYGRALEIISDLAVRFPDRNLFYADQIRYLQKLVVLQQMGTQG